MEKRFLFVLCISLIASVLATEFTADITIDNIPNVFGTLTGKMYYSSDKQKIRIDYNVQGTGRPIEVIDYNPDQQVRYLGCTSKCQAESYKVPFPNYHKLSSDSVPSGSGCGTDNVRSTNGLDKQLEKMRFTSASLPCRAQLHDGTFIHFSNVVITSLSQATFSVSSWNCPAKTCNIRLDMAIVLDCSGSVAGEWSTEKNFAYNLADSFTIGTHAVMIGLVTFSSGSQLEFNLLADKGSVLTGINHAVNCGGNTCIGCGLRTARNILGGSIARAGVQKMIVLVTDGQNNVNTYNPTTEATSAKNSGYWIFVIGVTSSVDTAQLKKIASSDASSPNDGYYTINGQRIQTYYNAPRWSDLATVVQTLIKATCQDLPGSPCGTGCHGFCSCDRECVCPDVCPSPNSCTVSDCKPSSNGAGCFNTPKDCTDPDACTIDTCDTSLPDGCKHTFNPVCPPRPCHTAQCVSPFGCVYTPIDCSDTNPCTNNFCATNNDSCVFTVVPCNLCQDQGLNAAVCQSGKNPCDVWDCVQHGITSAGCEIVSPKSCDDQNACTSEVCDRNSGNCTYTLVNCDDGDPCTTDTCDVTTGCINTPVNETQFCDDLNVCTHDYCVTREGCKHDTITCVGGDYCTGLQCDPVNGCELTPIDCAKIPDFADKIGTGKCYVAECNDGSSNSTLPYLGCNLRQVTGTHIDKCGVCQGNGQSCFLGVGVATAAGIGAGVLAAIIIGVVAGVAIVGAIAGKKGYDAYMRHRREMMGAQNNALYVDPGTSGNNPFYGTEMKPR